MFADHISMQMLLNVLEMKLRRWSRNENVGWANANSKPDLEFEMR